MGQSWVKSATDERKDRQRWTQRTLLLDQELYKFETFCRFKSEKKNTNMSSLIFDQANKVDTKSTITCFYLVLLKTLKATLFFLCFCVRNHPVGTLNFPKN